MFRVLGMCLLLAAVTFFPRATYATPYCADPHQLCATEKLANCTQNPNCTPMYGFTGTCSCNIYPPGTACSCF